MKQLNPKIGLAKICRLFGVSRQAYYQRMDYTMDTELEHELVIKEVQYIRQNHPRIGTRKLYVMMEEFMMEHRIKMGRDALFDLLSEYHLLIRRRRRTVRTTQSNHWMKKYPNLIKELRPNRPNELWVSDITYWWALKDPLYINFITDAYSHKIVGYCLSDTLEAKHSVEALKMALLAFEGAENRFKSLIHHSDRGSQYCSEKYVKLLQDYNAQISMTESGDPRDNAVAERVNGILKNEYLTAYTVETMAQAQKLLGQVVQLYNQERPHMSIGNLVPEKVHNHQLKKGKQLWKNYYQKNQTVN